MKKTVLLLPLLAVLLLGCPAAGAGPDDTGEQTSTQDGTTQDGADGADGADQAADTALTLTGFETSVTEGAADGTLLGSVTASRSGGTFSISSVNVSGAVAVDSSGQVTIADASLFDHEVNSSIEAEIEVSVDSSTATGTVEITVVDSVLDRDEGLLVYLPLDGDLEDLSGNDNDATAEENVNYTSDRDDGSNKAAALSATVFSLPDLYDSNDSFTVAAWINNDGSRDRFDRTIVTKVTTAGFVEFAWRLRKEGNESWQDGRIEAFFANNGSNGVNGGGNFPSEEWEHVALTYTIDSAGVRTATLYRDGAAVATSSDITLTLGSGKLYIGGRLNGSGEVVQQFSGAMDELTLFDRALTAAEVDALADATRVAPSQKATSQESSEEQPVREAREIGSIAEVIRVSR